MSPLSTSAVNQVGAATPGSLGSAASILMLRKALDLESSNAMQLIEALPQTAPANTGTLGTIINTYA